MLVQLVIAAISNTAMADLAVAVLVWLATAESGVGRLLAISSSVVGLVFAGRRAYAKPVPGFRRRMEAVDFHDTENVLVRSASLLPKPFSVNGLEKAG